MPLSGHVLQLNLDRAQARFLNQEVLRLKEEYGIRVTPHDIVRCLIDLHKAKMAAMATDDPNAVLWCYRYLAEGKDR
jgi:hypothetical protein